MDWLQLRPRINSLGRVRCEPGWDLRWTEPDRLKDFDLWFVWAGSGRMVLMDREVDLLAGRCFWMRPGRTYVADQDLNHRLGVTYIHFDLVGSEGEILEPARIDLPAETFMVSEVGYFNTITQRIMDRVRLLSEADHRVAALARAEAETLLYGLILGCVSGDLLRPGGPSGGPRRRRAALLHEQAQRILESPEKRWDVTRLARETGCSARHFARLFKQTTGQAPRDFIVDARVERAKHLLRNLDRSVTEIADVLGYADVFLFSRQFKARAGVSPGRYRLKF